EPFLSPLAAEDLRGAEKRRKRRHKPLRDVEEEDFGKALFTQCAEQREERERLRFFQHIQAVDGGVVCEDLLAQGRGEDCEKGVLEAAAQRGKGGGRPERI